MYRDSTLNIVHDSQLTHHFLYECVEPENYLMEAELLSD